MKKLTYVLDDEHDYEGVLEAARKNLTENLMLNEETVLPGDIHIVRAKAAGGVIGQFAGMDYRLTVRFIPEDTGILHVEIGGTRWDDKIREMWKPMFILDPLCYAGIGCCMQMWVVVSLKKAIDDYFGSRMHLISVPVRKRRTHWTRVGEPLEIQSKPFRRGTIIL